MKRIIKKLAFSAILVFSAVFCFALAGCTAENVIVEKISSVSIGKTLYAQHELTYSGEVYDGAKVTFTFNVTNVGENGGKVIITDTIPNGFKVVDEDADVENGEITLKVKVKQGQKATASYTLMVTDGGEGFIDGKNAKANGKSVVCNDLYVAKTFNDIDAKYVDLSMKVLSKSNYKGIDLAQRVYTAAISNTTSIKGLYPESLDEFFARLISSEENDLILKSTVAPCLFGGTGLAESINGVKGTGNKAITKADLVSGDLLFVQNTNDSMYIVGENQDLYDLNNNLVKVNTEELLSGLNSTSKYAVVRPSMSFKSFSPSDPNERALQLENWQKAVLETANAFFLRGDSMQYEDSTHVGNNIERSSYGKVPEEYTYNNVGYSNCAMFTHDVYYATFGEKMPFNMWTTMSLTNNSKDCGMQVLQYKNLNTEGVNYSEQEKLNIEKEVMQTIQPGDMFVVRRTANTGHVMLYIGNGKFIHSGGYSLRKPSETRPHVEDPREATIRYHKIYDYLFDSSSSNYLFGGNITTFTMVRPTMNPYVFNNVTQNTLNRMQNLSGVRADKTSNKGPNVTVNKGDEITYTFTLFNTNSHSVTLELKDVIDQNTTLVSGYSDLTATECVWSVTVEANQTKTISYTVKVKDNVEYGTAIKADKATVGGVKLFCNQTEVRRTLNAQERLAIVNAINNLKVQGTTLTNIELVNQIYSTALNGKVAFAESEFSNVLGDVGVANSIFETTNNIKYYLRINSEIFKAIGLKTLYGGEGYYESYTVPFRPELSSYSRTEVVTEHNLIEGDVVLFVSNQINQTFMYIGNNSFVNLTNGIEYDDLDFTTRCVRLLETTVYCVLRPSMAFN